MLVAMAILIVLILVMGSIMSQASRVWRHSRESTDAFRSAREAFERITTHLSQATLATYLDYYNAAGQSRTDVLRSNPSATFTATSYDRASDLQFVCGQAATLIPPSGDASSRPTHAVFFQAPLGYVASGATSNSDFRVLNTLVNGVGFYIDFLDENASRPGFITSAASKWRFCLKELYQPSQDLSIYTSGNGSPFVYPQAWFNQAIGSSGTSSTVTTAENVVALIIQPEAAVTTGSSTSIAPNYAYDTKGYLTSSADNAKIAKNQLPPMVRVTLVALDADSGMRLASIFGKTPPPLIGTTSFTDASQYEKDMDALEGALKKYHLTYRVFVSDVSLFGAQWSQTYGQ
jgi:uncharacterized protein (TIGR02599 family)